MQEEWQLYDDQGRPLADKGATKTAVFERGLLHAAAHVWIWRRTAEGAEVLLQKRASTKKTWPDLLDISAAGHVALGEDPLAAAVREIREEIGLEISVAELRFISVDRRYLLAAPDAIENELCWVYLLELPQAENFILKADEVASLQWKKVKDFAAETSGPTSEGYVPQGPLYFAKVVAGIEAESRE